MNDVAKGRVAEGLQILKSHLGDSTAGRNFVRDITKMHEKGDIDWTTAKGKSLLSKSLEKFKGQISIKGEKLKHYNKLVQQIKDGKIKEAEQTMKNFDARELKKLGFDVSRTLQDQKHDQTLKQIGTKLGANTASTKYKNEWDKVQAELKAELGQEGRDDTFKKNKVLLDRRLDNSLDLADHNYGIHNNKKKYEDDLGRAMEEYKKGIYQDKADINVDTYGRKAKIALDLHTKKQKAKLKKDLKDLDVEAIKEGSKDVAKQNVKEAGKHAEASLGSNILMSTNLSLYEDRLAYKGLHHLPKPARKALMEHAAKLAGNVKDGNWDKFMELFTETGRDEFLAVIDKDGSLKLSKADKENAWTAMEAFKGKLSNHTAQLRQLYGLQSRSSLPDEVRKILGFVLLSDTPVAASSKLVESISTSGRLMTRTVDAIEKNAVFGESGRALSDKQLTTVIPVFNDYFNQIDRASVAIYKSTQSAPTKKGYVKDPKTGAVKKKYRRKVTIDKTTSNLLSRYEDMTDDWRDMKVKDASSFKKFYKKYRSLLNRSEGAKKVGGGRSPDSLSALLGSPLMDRSAA